MSIEDGVSPAKESLDFVESALLDIIVPLDSKTPLDRSLKEAPSSSGEGIDYLATSIEQRQLLFFDESLDAHIVLRTPYIDEVTLKAYLSRLAIDLEVHAVETSVQSSIEHAENYPRGSTPSSDLIYADTVDPAVEPLVILQDSSQDEGQLFDLYAFVVWRIHATLNRPRVKLQNPMIRFTAGASLKTAEQIQPEVRKEEYLPSLAPGGINLLESLKGDPVLADSNPRLSALRVSRVLPVTRMAQELLRPLKSSSQIFRAVPPISARVRYTKSITHSTKHHIIASLDLEVPFATGCSINFGSVELHLIGGKVYDLNNGPNPILPVTCQPEDSITLLYKLVQDEDYEDISVQSSRQRTLELCLCATVLVADVCRSPISMRWKSNVEFISAPSWSSTDPALTRDRKARPPNIEVKLTAPSGPTTPFPNGIEGAPPTRLKKSSNQNDGHALQEFQTVESIGVSITINGPAHTRVGEMFHWNIFVVNRSSRIKKLAITAIPKRKGVEVLSAARPSSSGAKGRRQDVADAVLDENIVYAMQRTAVAEPTELICMTTEVLIGSVLSSVTEGRRSDYRRPHSKANRLAVHLHLRLATPQN
ncbi:MAG: hypothetical protein M1825_004286 [Sarcosagium campestre]|nr:MAG: hypothetical protein M1825_004286 [Sarcosagium campestre]